MWYLKAENTGFVVDLINPTQDDLMEGLSDISHREELGY